MVYLGVWFLEYSYLCFVLLTNLLFSLGTSGVEKSLACWLSFSNSTKTFTTQSSRQLPSTPWSAFCQSPTRNQYRSRFLELKSFFQVARKAFRTIESNCVSTDHSRKPCWLLLRYFENWKNRPSYKALYHGHFFRWKDLVFGNFFIGFIWWRVLIYFSVLSLFAETIDSFHYEPKNLASFPSSFRRNIGGYPFELLDLLMSRLTGKWKILCCITLRFFQIKFLIFRLFIV